MERVLSEGKPAMEKEIFSTKSLAEIALFLEGFKQGRGGNILPLGNDHLEQLWKAIKYLNGDVRYECAEQKKRKSTK